MTTIPYLEGPEFDDEDDDLVSLTSIFNEIKSKLKIEKGIVYEWFILVEETENEEDFEDNIYSVKAFIPPED